MLYGSVFELTGPFFISVITETINNTAKRFSYN